MLEVSEKEEGVMTLHLPIGPLKTCSGLELVPRCDPSTYQSNSQWQSHSVSSDQLTFKNIFQPVFHKQYIKGFPGQGNCINGSISNQGSDTPAMRAETGQPPRGKGFHV